MLTATFKYAAPELLLDYSKKDNHGERGKIFLNEITPRLDIYSLGLTLFETVDPGLMRTSEMELKGLIDQLIVNNDLKNVISKAIYRDPNKRYGTALEFKKALEKTIKF